jgi:uncharacterized protein (DUF2336 family)
MPVDTSLGLFMIVRRFLQWAQTAQASQRADGARALAQAYLKGDLDDSERHDADIALTALLDDASPLVRQALAEALAGAPEAPRHLIGALAHDQSDIAAIVLNRSPLLSDAELIDAAVIGDAFVQVAIALRPFVSVGLATALAEIGSREALISLAVNLGAEVTDAALHRMLERFGSDGELREALLTRPNLPASLRHDLAAATALALSSFVTECQWLSRERADRVTKDARERATLAIAASGTGEDCLRLVRHLRGGGHLTAGLILRALLCGHTGLFEASLADLAGLPLNRVIGLVRERRGAGFAALYRKARLPAVLLPAFQAALAGLEECGAAVSTLDGAHLSLVLIERVLAACSQEGAETGKLLALLRRFEAEAAREAARAQAQDMLRQAPFVAIGQVDNGLAARLEPDLPGLTERSFAADASVGDLRQAPLIEVPGDWRGESEAAICINVAALPVTFRGEAWLDRAKVAAPPVDEPFFLWIEPEAASVREASLASAPTMLELPAVEDLAQDGVRLSLFEELAASELETSAILLDEGKAKSDTAKAPLVFEPDPASGPARALVDAIRIELGLAGAMSEPGTDDALDGFFEELQPFVGAGFRQDSSAYRVAA